MGITKTMCILLITAWIWVSNRTGYEVKRTKYTLPIVKLSPQCSKYFTNETLYHKPVSVDVFSITALLPFATSLITLHFDFWPIDQETRALADRPSQPGSIHSVSGISSKTGSSLGIRLLLKTSRFRLHMLIIRLIGLLNLLVVFSIASTSHASQGL